MAKRIPRSNSNVRTVRPETTGVYEVYNQKKTVHVYARSYEDARDTCLAHGYLEDDGEEWGFAEIFYREPGWHAAFAEADRRFERLHGRA